jgi:diacylglycerol kinase (ATP)
MLARAAPGERSAALVDEVHDRDRVDTSDATPESSEAFSLRARARSFRFAGQGIATLLASQHNAWIHGIATILVVALAFGLAVSAIEWALLVLAIAGVWVAEAMNTAIEALADALIPEHHPLVGRAKDVAAGGVLIAAIGAAIVGFVILGPKLLVWIGS